MRKQYYFRQSPNGLLAWDIHRLISLSSNLTIKSVSLNDIRELDEDYWFKNESINPTCKAVAEHIKLVEQTNLKFPIILSQNGAVMDGMHRIVKAYVNGKKIIKAVQFEKDPEPDYVDVDPKLLPYD